MKNYEGLGILLALCATHPEIKIERVQIPKVFNSAIYTLSDDEIHEKVNTLNYKGLRQAFENVISTIYERTFDKKPSIIDDETIYKLLKDSLDLLEYNPTSVNYDNRYSTATINMDGDLVEDYEKKLLIKQKSLYDSINNFAITAQEIRPQINRQNNELFAIRLAIKLLTSALNDNNFSEDSIAEAIAKVEEEKEEINNIILDIPDMDYLKEKPLSLVEKEHTNINKDRAECLSLLMLAFELDIEFVNDPENNNTLTIMINNLKDHYETPFTHVMHGRESAYLDVLDLKEYTYGKLLEFNGEDINDYYATGSLITNPLIKKQAVDALKSKLLKNKSRARFLAKDNLIYVYKYLDLVNVGDDERVLGTVALTLLDYLDENNDKDKLLSLTNMHMDTLRQVIDKNYRIAKNPTEIKKILESSELIKNKEDIIDEM